MPNYDMSIINKYLSGIIIFILALTSCNRSKSGLDIAQIDYIKSTVWNLDLPDSIINTKSNERESFLYKSYYKDCPLFFIDSNVYFRDINNKLGNYVFSHDTLIIYSNYIKSGPESMRNVTDTVFKGKITQISSDILEILRIKDSLFDQSPTVVLESNTLRFYNDSLIRMKETKFNILSLTCKFEYGPMEAIEIDSLGILHYYCSKNKYRDGFYKAKMDSIIVNTLTHLLSPALINKDGLKLFDLGEDSSVKLKIIIENNDTLSIRGDPWLFNYRLWQIYNILRSSVRSDRLEKDSLRYEFLSNRSLEIK